MWWLGGIVCEIHENTTVQPHINTRLLLEGGFRPGRAGTHPRMPRKQKRKRTPIVASKASMSSCAADPFIDALNDQWVRIDAESFAHALDGEPWTYVADDLETSIHVSDLCHLTAYH